MAKYPIIEVDPLVENIVTRLRAHIVDKKCPAGKCKDLLAYTVVADKCIGCTACARVCPVNCISGEVKKVHTIDQAQCIKCGQCFTKCKFDAILKG